MLVQADVGIVLVNHEDSSSLSLHSLQLAGAPGMAAPVGMVAAIPTTTVVYEQRVSSAASVFCCCFSHVVPGTCG